jgi:hypothetical protein
MSFRIENRLGVSAPAEIVWEVITDLPRWAEWNPLYTSAEGEIGFGKALVLTIAIPGEAPETIRPVIISWTPEELLHWRMSLSGGFLRSVRYLEIHRLSDVGCIFSNGEAFRGVASWFFPKRMKRALRQGFAALGEAVKAESERLWRERGQAPT